MTVIVSAGHVDHGKSALIRALTGTDPDRWAEEKRRGMTIDLGFAHTVLPSGRSVSFVDVPGHHQFVRNMLVGVGTADACLFVVDAGEGWRPQSEEHLRILDLLGVRDGVIALAKIDQVDDETVELARLDVADHVVGTALATAPVIATSATTGAGIDQLRTALDELVVPSDVAGAEQGRSRLWVDRSFTVAGSGTVVTGVSLGGGFAVDDRVVIGPQERPGRIRGIQVRGTSIDRVGPRERVALNLGGVARTEVARGHAVVRPGEWIPTRRFDAELSTLAALDHDVKSRGNYVLHAGTAEQVVRLQVIGGRSIEPGSTGLVRLTSAGPWPLPLEPGDRFIVRESGRRETIGGGLVLDVAPVRSLSRAAPDRRWERVVAERRWVTVDELWRLTGHRAAAVVGPWVAERETVAELAASLRERIRAAPPPGLSMALLDDHERAVLETLDDVDVAGEWATAADARDVLAEHPVVAELFGGGFQPPAPDAPRDVLRELRRRGVLAERDGVWFHREAVDSAARVAARLIAADPEGFTVAQFRDATGATRKFCLPLLNELDARGITRKRDPVRIAGPSLPPADGYEVT